MLLTAIIILFARLLHALIVTGFTKMFQMAHLVIRELPISNIEPTVALFCWGIAMPDIQYN